MLFNEFLINCIVLQARALGHSLQGKHPLVQLYLGQDQIILTGFSLIPPELCLQDEVKLLGS